MTAALHIHQLNKHFANGKHALRDINLTVQRGEMVALIGASGSGKSTLLRHVAGLVVADAASDSLIEVDGRCVQQGGRIHSDIRKVRSQVGFVFQQFNLVDRLPVLMNVLVGLLHRTPWWRGWLRMFKPQERALALEALHRVGIAECHAQRASTLSGGQQQRAAIARTLVQGAKVVLADEPIASLDPESSRKVMDILARINREDRCTVIVSLHRWMWPSNTAPAWWPCTTARWCTTALRRPSRPHCCAACMACTPTKFCRMQRVPPQHPCMPQHPSRSGRPPWSRPPELPFVSFQFLSLEFSTCSRNCVPP